MELHFLDVPKFKKKPINKMTRIERWLAYFSNKLNNTEMEELIMSDAAIKNAVNDTGIFMQDIEERLKYINRQMAIMDYNTDMRVSREEGRKEGREEGRREERLKSIRNLITKNNWTSKQAMDALMIPEDEQEKLLPII